MEIHSKQRYDTQLKQDVSFWSHRSSLLRLVAFGGNISRGIQEEVAQEIDQLLSVIFADLRKTGGPVSAGKSIQARDRSVSLENANNSLRGDSGRS